MLTRLRWCAVLLAVIGFGILTGCGKSSSSSGSSAGALFVTTQGDTLVSAFHVDLGNGRLSTNGAGVATGSAPAAGKAASLGFDRGPFRGRGIRGWFGCGLGGRLRYRLLRLGGSLPLAPN